jgi:hypothetical protein
MMVAFISPDDAQPFRPKHKKEMACPFNFISTTMVIGSLTPNLVASRSGMLTNRPQQTDGSWVVTVNECILEAPDLHSAMRIFADNYDRSLVQLSPMTDADNWNCEEDESEVTVIDLSSLDRPSDLRMQEAEDFMTTAAEVSHQTKAPQALPEEPKLENFPDEESFLEARDSWRHHVMPILRLAQSTMKRRSEGPPTMATFTGHDEVVGADVPASRLPIWSRQRRV